MEMITQISYNDNGNKGMPRKAVKREEYLGVRCAQCGQKFFAPTVRAKYCGGYCKLKAHRGRIRERKIRHVEP